MSRAPFYYLLTEDNTTAQLSAAPAPWGRDLVGVPSSGGFQMTDWHALAHVILPRLAAHPARTMDASRASCCVVASPTYTTLRRAGEIVQSRECRVNAAHTPGRLAALGAEKCAGKPIVVIDGADGDGANTALCTAVWNRCSGLSDPLVRVTGNAPGLRSDVAMRGANAHRCVVTTHRSHCGISAGARARCRQLSPLPYLTHARSHLAAAPASGRRPVT